MTRPPRRARRDRRPPRSAPGTSPTHLTVLRLRRWSRSSLACCWPTTATDDALAGRRGAASSRSPPTPTGSTASSPAAAAWSPSFGKLADPIADKALTGAALVGLSLLGELPWWVTVVVLVREIGVTLLRFWVIRHGVMPASRGGKLKTAAAGRRDRALRAAADGLPRHRAASP